MHAKIISWNLLFFFFFGFECLVSCSVFDEQDFFSVFIVSYRAIHTLFLIPGGGGGLLI